MARDDSEPPVYVDADGSVLDTAGPILTNGIGPSILVGLRALDNEVSLSAPAVTNVVVEGTSKPWVPTAPTLLPRAAASNQVSPRNCLCLR